MNATTMPVRQQFSYGSMKSAAVFSVVLHAALFAMGMVSVPFLKKDITPPPPIVVEIVNPDEITQTDKIAKAPEKIEKPPLKKEAIDKPVAPPKVELEKPPQVVKPKPIEPKDVKKKPKEVPPPPKKEELKEPEPKKEEVKEEEASQPDQFASLLKNLQESEETASVSAKEITEKVVDAPDAPIAQTITQSEWSRLHDQLGQCWIIPIGLEDVHTMNVSLHIWASPFGDVQRVEFADPIRVQLDEKYRVLAESARKAVLSPACSPLQLPLDKKDLWKDQYIVVHFDPRWVL